MADESTALVRKDGIESKLVVPDRNLGVVEARNLLVSASAYQERERIDRDLVGLELRDNMDQVALYEAADELGISREYVDRARKVLYPSFEDNMEIMKVFNGIPSRKILLNTYSHFLMEAFEEFLPVYDIVSSRNDYRDGAYDYSQLKFSNVSEKEIIKKRLFSRKSYLAVKKEYKTLLVMDFSKLDIRKPFRLDINFYDSSVAQVSKPIIEKLNQNFNIEMRNSFIHFDL